MGGLTIGWEYLTGYCRATDSASRARAEWPPHPARVFMALAAAWFETGREADEGIALRWLEELERLGQPELILPPSREVFPRKIVDFYVPVNDRADPFDWPDKKKKPTIHANLGSVAVGRSRQARTFPCTWVGERACFLRWPNAKDVDVDTHRSALDRLCGKVTRIGHSSSLVRMWLAEGTRLPRASETWVADDVLAEFEARRVCEGNLNLLDVQFNGRSEEHRRLSAEIKRMKTAKKDVKGRGSKERKAEIDVEIDKLSDRLKSVDNRDPIRPKPGLWSGYRLRESDPAIPSRHTDFDSDMLILTQVGGPRLPSVSTLAVTQALRRAVMKHSGLRSPPPWVSGHAQAGDPVRDGKQHMAFVPLPFVGRDYADGHLLGAALMFPRWVLRQERGQVLGRMLLEPSGEPKSIELQLGAIGVWTILKREWSEARIALKPETWSAHPVGSRNWASVTPVVLDGFPKEDRLRDRPAWNSEVLAMLARACQRVGLPEPTSVDFDTTSWHHGSPRASLKRRPLRGHPEVGDATAGMGDGFPPYPAKGTSGIRPQFHLWLQFAEPVVGPVLLGAGRFLGYGLCKPLCGVPS